MFPAQAPYPNFNTTITHFTHMGHLLTELNSNSEYLCNGCKTLGTGSSFRCNPCNFDLHEYCAKCPNVLSSFMHPAHQLTLLVRKSQGMRTNSRNCNICNGSLEGLFYWCTDCEFNVHPLCTQLPQFLRHKLHDAHPLTLQAPETASSCVVCRGTCGANSWRYRCGDCGGFDIHMECVLVVSQAPEAVPPPSPSHQSRRLPPYAGEYVYAGVHSGSNYHQAPAYNHMYNCYGGVASGSDIYYNMHSPAYANHYQVPAAYNHHVHNIYPHQQGQGGGQPANGSLGKKMYSVVGKLALGVVSNVIFGVGFPGLN